MLLLVYSFGNCRVIVISYLHNQLHYFYSSCIYYAESYNVPPPPQFLHVNPMLPMYRIKSSRSIPFIISFTPTWIITVPVDTGRKLNVHKTFRRRPGHLLNVLCTFNLRPVFTGVFKTQSNI